MSTVVKALLERDSEIARAVAEVDRELIRTALERSPLERAKVATSHLRALRRLSRAASQGS